MRKYRNCCFRIPEPGNSFCVVDRNRFAGTLVRCRNPVLNGLKSFQTGVVDMKPTGTVTFLFADIVGASLIDRKWPASEAGSACLGSMISDVIVRNHGIVYWSSGFRYCCAFVLPLDAVIAANQIQSRLGSGISEMNPVIFRIAVHTGEAQEADGHYSGSTVNRVLQLLSVARPGEVLVSSSVETLVTEFLPEDLQF